jgi:hypothetical protein
MTRFYQHLTAAILRVHQLAECWIMRKKHQAQDWKFRSVERRSSRRYELALNVRCKLIKPDEIIVGKTRDISSRGISFTIGEVLPTGTEVELSIDWPCLLQQTCLLQLRVRGNVVRWIRGCVVVSIQQYEFCTRKRNTGGI